MPYVAYVLCLEMLLVVVFGSLLLCDSFIRVTSGKVRGEKIVCISEDFLEVLIGHYGKGGRVNHHKDLPVFFASLSKDTSLTGVNAILKFDDVRTNRRHGCNPSTGIFTAPQKGIYQFNCLIRVNGNSQLHFQLRKNSKLFTMGYASKNHYNSQTISSILELKEGDRVYIQQRHVGSAENIRGDHSSTFAGYLLT